MDVTDENARPWNTTLKQAKLCGIIERAIKAGDLKQVSKLLDAHPETLGWISSSGSLLHEAARRGQVAIMKELVKRGADIQVRGGVSRSNALYTAISYNQYEAAKYLLDLGVAIEVPGKPNWSPLFSVIYEGNVKMLHLLIDHGVNLHPDHWDPIDFSRMHNRESVFLDRLVKAAAEQRAKQKAKRKGKAKRDAKAKAKAKATSTLRSKGQVKSKREEAKAASRAKSKSKCK
jgi:uncharacterized protein